MTTDVEFSTKFKDLLTKVPKELSLEQWQYLYGQVMFTMGEKILELFPERALGHNPFTGSGGAPAPHQGGGGSPPTRDIHGKGGGVGPHAIGPCLANCIMLLT